MRELIEPWFIFSLIWSVGATGDAASRQRFSAWLRKKMKQEKVLNPNNYSLNELQTGPQMQRTFETLQTKAIEILNIMNNNELMVSICRNQIFLQLPLHIKLDFESMHIQNVSSLSGGQLFKQSVCFLSRFSCVSQKRDWCMIIN